MLRKTVQFARRRPFLTTFVLALAARSLFQAVTRPDPLSGIDSLEYDTMARQLLAGRGFVSEVGFVRPPLYPSFIAILYAIGGIHLLQAAQIVLSAATAPLIAVLARYLYADPRVALPVGMIGALYPWFFWWVGTIASENLFTFMAVLSFVSVMWASRRREPASLVAGLCFGAAALARANVLALAPGLAVWWWVDTKALMRPALFAIGVVLALVPFAVYNLQAGNGLVLASSGGGMIFFAGNNSDTARWYLDDLPSDEWERMSKQTLLGDAAYAALGCDPSLGLSECVGTVPTGDRETFWYRAAFSYIAGHPVRWVQTEFAKLWHYWRPWVEPRVYPMSLVVISGVSFGLVLGLALAGLRSMAPSSAWFVIAIGIGSTLAAVIWFVQLRYRFALLDPVLISAGAGPALALWRWLASRPVGRFFGTGSRDDAVTAR